MLVRVLRMVLDELYIIIALLKNDLTFMKSLKESSYPLT